MDGWLFTAFRHSNSLRMTLAAILALVAVQAAHGQGTGSGSSITEVYNRTRSAKTVQDFAAVIDECRAMQAGQLTRTNADYLRRLMSFAQNKRGELYANQASDLQDQGKSEEAARLDALAMADFESAVKNDPSRWKALHNRGVSLAVDGKYEEAVADFSRAIQLNERYANAWFNRAEIYYELGRFAEAERDYTKTLQLLPEDQMAQTNRGHARFQLGRYRDALSDYNRVVELAPNNADAFANRGDAYRSMGSWQQAANDYRRAIQADQNSGRAYQSAAWLMATCPDESYRKTELAVQAAERAMELEPQQDSRLLDTLAAAYANAGRFDDAVETMSQSIKMAPENEVEVLRQRQQLYQSRRPYRQPRPRTQASSGRNATSGSRRSSR